jgi:hypothetical protein
MDWRSGSSRTEERKEWLIPTLVLCFSICCPGILGSCMSSWCVADRFCMCPTLGEATSSWGNSSHWVFSESQLTGLYLSGVSNPSRCLALALFRWGNFWVFWIDGGCWGLGLGGNMIILLPVSPWASKTESSLPSNCLVKSEDETFHANLGNIATFAICIFSRLLWAVDDSCSK